MAWAFLIGIIACAPIVQAFDSFGPAPAAPVPAAPAAASGVSNEANKKIKMVTETLRDILQSVVNEETQETILHGKYMAWCKTERGNIADDLEDTRTDLSSAMVLSQEQVSTIDSLKLFISKSTKEIEETKDGVAQAVSLRTEENDKYTEELQFNTQSLRQIELAIKHVSKVNKQGGFLQNGVIKKMQLNVPGESNYVMGIMKGIEDKLIKSRTSMKSTEAEKVKMHDQLMAIKGAALKALSDQLAEKNILNAETVAKEAGTKRNVGKLVEEVDQLEKTAAKTSDACQESSAEWKIREADRAKEKAALNEALLLLPGKDTSLVQLSLVQGSADPQNDALGEFAPNFIQEVASSNEFAKAAEAELNGEDDEVHLKKDTFNGVKTVVEKLIDSHQDNQKAEKTQKDYCEKEIAGKEDERDDTQNDLAAVSADIDKKAAEVATLEGEVTKLYAQIDTVRKSVVAAGDVRKQEADVFVAGTKDRALAVKVLGQAVTVLQAFYDKSKKGSLMQTHASAPERTKWSPGSARKTTASFGVVSMVEGIAQDIAKEQKDAALQEKEAVDVYADLQTSSQRNNDDRQQDITDRVKITAKLGVQINTLKETKTEKSNELVSVKKQLVALHSQCDELTQFYDKRKTSRTFEVSQLKDVMDVLSGSSVAARTGLMQDSDEAAFDVAEKKFAADDV